MKDHEQLARELGYGDPVGFVMLKADEVKGIVPGFLQHGEHAREVEVDLTRLVEGRILVRPLNRVEYVVPADMMEAIQCIVGAQLDAHHERTMLSLRNMLGEERTDRFIEFLGLGGLTPESTTLEKVVPSRGVVPSQQ